MAEKCSPKTALEPVDAGVATLPPPPPAEVRLRLPLATAGDVRRELARLYREGKAGRRGMSDVSRLGNLLAILGRLIETSELEARIERLEEAR